MFVISYNDCCHREEEKRRKAGVYTAPHQPSPASSLTCFLPYFPSFAAQPTRPFSCPATDFSRWPSSTIFIFSTLSVLRMMLLPSILSPTCMWGIPTSYSHNYILWLPGVTAKQNQGGNDMEQTMSCRLALNSNWQKSLHYRNVSYF